MKSIELILLIVSSWAITTVVGKSNLYTGWTMKFADNTPYEDQTAEVGDTITFIWTDDEVQNVFIHPTNDCNQTGRIPVGNQSPTTYTFTADDASPEGKEIFFVCDIGDRCEDNGMRMAVTVFPSPDDASFGTTSDPVAVNSPPVSLTATPTNPLMATGSPVAATDAPVEPTIPPVAPTGAPVEPTIPPVASTDAPVEYTESPVASIAPTDTLVEPTIPPVEPTGAPIEPTAAPVAPTQSPIEPSEAPIAPTDSPIEPTEAPIEPTNPPTDAPVAPVSFPTVSPTISPTNSPTKAPTPSPTTSSPTTSPPVATGMPTISPTLVPSAKVVEPVAVPTESPTISQPVDEPSPAETKKTMRGLQMTVDGISSFSGSTMDAWKDTTEIFCTSHYKRDYSGSTFKTTITVTNSQKVSQRHRWMMRGQQRLLIEASGFVITYNQVVSYDSTASDITENYLAKSAFEFPKQRNDYVQSLQNSGDPVLDTATDATAPTYANDNVPTSVPAVISNTQAPTTAEKDPPLSLAAIIGIACGGGALLIIIILFFIYCNKKGSKENPNIDSNPPPRSVSLKEDEVSTLAGPSVTGGGALGDRRLTDFKFQLPLQSVGTVDYDYSKAYGNGDTSVSSAGGTFGSNTQNISLPANAAATGAALGPYDDDGSYEAHFRNPGNNVKEEILHIFAPPGKLGVVIDTPDDGAPVVHAVKDSSVVVDKVQVGDKLVAVDDEDVRTLTAIKVSKLISRKSANPSRKLTILRTTLIE